MMRYYKFGRFVILFWLLLFTVIVTAENNNRFPFQKSNEFDDSLTLQQYESFNDDSNNNNNNIDDDYDMTEYNRMLELVGTFAPEVSSFIAGYFPSTVVIDAASLDLDQQSIQTLFTDIEISESSLQLKLLSQAKDIYENGQNSQIFARLTLDVSLRETLPERSLIMGSTINGNEIRGALEVDTYLGSTTLDVLYPLPLDPGTLECKPDNNNNNDDGMSTTPDNDPIDGCFASSGTIRIRGEFDTTYSYNRKEDNLHLRTIQGFSTRSQNVVTECDKCPFPLLQKYITYYGNFDYADTIIQAAFMGSQTNNLKNANSDFSTVDITTRVEFISKATVLLNFWMAVVANLEAAIRECPDTPRPRKLDEAFAYYAGSLEGTDGAGKGVLLYNLSQEICTWFGTCRSNQNRDVSIVNYAILQHFLFAKSDLLEGNCSSAVNDKKRIISLLTVLLAQGTLRYAYTIDVEGNTGSKERGIGFAFASAILPLLHDCNVHDAAIVYNNFELSSSTTNFEAVKRALERNYQCMGIICEDVGGLVDLEKSGLLYLSEPCVTIVTIPPTSAPASQSKASSFYSRQSLSFIIGLFAVLILLYNVA